MPSPGAVASASPNVSRTDHGGGTLGRYTVIEGDPQMIRHLMRRALGLSLPIALEQTYRLASQRDPAAALALLELADRIEDMLPNL